MEIEVNWQWLLWESGLVGDETLVIVRDSFGNKVARGYRDDRSVVSQGICRITGFCIFFGSDELTVYIF